MSSHMFVDSLACGTKLMGAQNQHVFSILLVFILISLDKEVNVYFSG